MMLADRIGGILLGTLGLAVVVAAMRLPSIPGQPIGPAVFPTVIGVVLGVLGLALLIAPQPSADQPRQGRDISGLLRMLSPVVILILGYFAMEPVGFLLTGIAIIFFCGLLLRGAIISSLMLGVVMTVLIYSVFSGLLRVPLPAGILSLPW
jgi:putative tricarboxylic transport membrane protein